MNEKRLRSQGHQETLKQTFSSSLPSPSASASCAQAVTVPIKQAWALSEQEKKKKGEKKCSPRHSCFQQKAANKKMAAKGSKLQ